MEGDTQLPRWQFEYKITFGNVLTGLILFGTITIGYANLNTTVRAYGETIEKIPGIEKRVDNIEVRIDNGKALREALSAKVDQQDSMLNGRITKQEETLNAILQTLARIEERVNNIQVQATRGS